MKSNIKKAILLVVAATFLLGSTLYAEHGYSGKKGIEYYGKEDKLESLRGELGITPEQEAKLSEQRKEFKAKNKKLMEGLRSKRKELKEELEKQHMNRARVNKIVKDIKNLTGEKLQNRVDKIVSMKNIFTPEQFEKLQDMMERKRHARMRSNRGKRQFRSQ